MSDIKAGSAYVEITVRDQTTAALRQVESKLRTFASGMRRFSLYFAGIGAAITAPLVSAARAFGLAGRETEKLAQQAGMGVEAWSAMSGAAELAEVSASDLSDAIAKYNRNIALAMDGNKTAKARIEDLGLSMSQLKQMTPDQQILAVADAIKQIENPARRTKAIMDLFGRGSMRLTEFLMSGSAGISELKNRAIELGNLDSPEEILRAKEYDKAMKEISMTLKNAWEKVGFAVAPIITKTVNAMIPFLTTVNKMLDKNPELIQTIFMVGTAFTAAAAASLTMSTGLSLLSFSFGKLSFLSGGALSALSILPGILVGIGGLARGASSGVFSLGKSFLSAVGSANLLTKAKDGISAVSNVAKRVLIQPKPIATRATSTALSIVPEEIEAVSAVLETLDGETIQPLIARIAGGISKPLSLIRSQVGAAEAPNGALGRMFPTFLKAPGAIAGATKSTLSVGWSIAKFPVNLIRGAVAKFPSLLKFSWGAIKSPFTASFWKGLAGGGMSLIRGLGTAFSSLSSIISGGLTGALNGLVGAFSMIVSPAGATIAIIAALAVAVGVILYKTGLLGDAWEWLKVQFIGLWQSLKDGFEGIFADASETWERITAVFTEAWGSITAALAKGDLATAGKIAWVGLKIVWKEGIGFLLRLWNSWADSSINVVDAAYSAILSGAIVGFQSLAKAWDTGVNFVSDIWDGFIGGIQTAWTKSVGFIVEAWYYVETAFLNGITGIKVGFYEMVKYVVPLINGLIKAYNNIPLRPGADLEEIAIQDVQSAQDEAVKKMNERESAYQKAKQGRIDAEVLEETKAEEKKAQKLEKRKLHEKARDDQTEGALNVVENEKRQRMVARSEASELSNKGNRDEIEALNKELQGLIAEAKKPAEKTTTGEEPQKNLAKELQARAPKIAAEMSKFEAIGTFNATRAFDFAGGGIQDRILKAAEEQAKLAKETADNTSAIKDALEDEEVL